MTSITTKTSPLSSYLTTSRNSKTTPTSTKTASTASTTSPSTTLHTTTKSPSTTTLTTTTSAFISTASVRSSPLIITTTQNNKTNQTDIPTTTNLPIETTTTNTDIQIYSCNFDSVCNGQLIKSNPSSTFLLRASAFIENTNYYITDYSSISELTLNNKKNCLIPFIYKNTTYNYCAPISGKFKCKINDNNSFDDCSKGNFLFGKSPNNGDPFESTYKTSLNIYNGMYKIKYHVLMYCSNVNKCIDAQDYIELNAYLGNSQIFRLNTKIDLNNIGEFNKWIELSTYFEIYFNTNSDLKVNFKIIFLINYNNSHF